MQRHRQSFPQDYGQTGGCGNTRDLRASILDIMKKESGRDRISGPASSVATVGLIDSALKFRSVMADAGLIRSDQ
jgi:hypothetical protein